MTLSCARHTTRVITEQYGGQYEFFGESEGMLPVPIQSHLQLYEMQSDVHIRATPISPALPLEVGRPRPLKYS